jgi:hypothetical protein
MLRFRIVHALHWFYPVYGMPSSYRKQMRRGELTQAMHLLKVV